MKRTAKAELRSTTAAELTKQAQALREQLLKGRLSGAIEGKGLGIKARQVRRQIARIETILGEQKRSAAGNKAKA
ncbi:MAG: 50S ribosomal protein L29 [Planctomycetes bacterium]|nr:50S ribosomal protein L29 [Planctomycetota bacterium]